MWQVPGWRWWNDSVKTGADIKQKTILTIQLLLFAACWLGSGKEISAQQAVLQGLVTDHTSAQPLYGANIVLNPESDEHALLGTTSDSEGYYRVASIQPGRWVVQISYVGYTSYTDTLMIREGESRSLNISLEPDDAELGELIVSGAGGAARREDGAQRISPVDLRRVPGPASGDLAAYLQTLPGVVSMGDRGGQVFIRGGTPSENMVLVDGALIYQPTHIVGFFSPFPQNLVSGVDFYAGGFGPRYSGRSSSVMDIRMKHGDLYSTSGTAALNPFAAEITAEGPIRTGQTSWIVSLRNSLIEETSSWYPIEKQPLRFQSQFAKASYIERDSRCSAMIMRTYDRGRMDFDNPESIRWRNFLLGGRCIALPEDSDILLDVNASMSHFTNSVGDTDSPFGFTSSISRINTEVNLRQYVGEVRFQYGLHARLKNLEYDLGEQFVGFDMHTESQFNIGGHFETGIPAGDLLLQPGFALSFYPGTYGVTVDPRFRFTWKPFGMETGEVTGAAGLYRQPIIGISDMRDLSSVFVAWMIGSVDDSQMEAIHTMIGWQQTLTDGFTWSVESYYKRIRNIPVPLWSPLARFTTDLVLAKGDVYGADLRVEYNRGRLYALIGYGYNHILYESVQDHFNEWFGEPLQEYHPPHDRRHQLNALFSLDVGSFTTAVRWQFGTGFPYTRPIGFDDLLEFRDRLPLTRSERGVRRVILEKPYQGRLPTYHRLDLSLSRSFRISRSGSELNLRAGAVNLYNRANLFYYDVYTHRRIDQLPFAPYLTIEMNVQ
ncbi:MAG: TonB-dependent receptor [Balneolaceae bacterium]